MQAYLIDMFPSFLCMYPGLVSYMLSSALAAMLDNPFLYSQTKRETNASHPALQWLSAANLIPCTTRVQGCFLAAKRRAFPRTSTLNNINL
jgi:hypothetical protein